MRVVFVVLNNYNNQKCIKENIENLKRFNNNDIVVLTDRKNTCYFDDTIEVITIESLIPEYEEYLTRVEKTFREGFSQLTKYRFKVLLEYLKKYDIEKMIHLENDVMVFKNLDELHFHDTNKVLITMDNPNRCIPGIMYIPSFKQLEACMLHWNGNTDMDCWANSFKNNKSKEIIDNLPIMKENSTIKTNHFELLTNNSSHYEGIFDAAAIGQYLGGIDPRNGKVKHFVNESCCVNYSKYNFIWKVNSSGFKCPYIIINDLEIPIYNLHVHSKNIKQFM